MSEPEKKDTTEEQSPVQNLVKKILPDDSILDIKNVLGNTTVDPALDDKSQKNTVPVPAPIASTIPKRPERGGPVQVHIPHSYVTSTTPNQQTVAEQQPVQLQSTPPIFGSRIGRFISVVIGLSLFFGMVAAIAYFLTSGREFVLPDILKNAEEAISQTDVVLENNAPNTVNASTNTSTTSPVMSGPADSDGDGLLDSQEEQLKTDPKKIDSDGDDLTDRQEVEIYNTSPLKKDSDDDSFSDGAEVRNFYNPNGDGQLVNVSEAIDSISNINAKKQ